MRAFENVSAITFTAEVLVVRDGQKLGRIRPDKDGYYCDLPVAALGVVTRNNTYYDAAEFVQQITDPRSFFNRMLVDGTLFGEYGHPDIAGLDHASQLNRLSVINEKMHSHHIRRVQMGSDLPSGGRLIVADVKPHGTYGAQLQESLDSPFVNTAFSLRSITHDRMDGGICRKKMRKLVTFDAVSASGYAESTKRFSAGTESIDVKINPEKDILCFDAVALESFADTELAEVFGTDAVELHRKSLSVIKGTGILKADNDAHLSLYHELVKAK